MKNPIQEEIKKVLEYYNLRFKSFEKVTGGRINDTYLVICDKDEKIIVQKAVLCSSGKSIENEAKLINFLKKNNFPVAPILTMSNKKSYVKVNGNFWKLSKYIEHDQKIIKSEERIFNLGKTLGAFHSFFRNYPEKDKLVEPFKFKETEILIEKLELLLEINKAEKSVIELVDSMKKIASKYKIPQNIAINILHGDPKFNNFLFKGNEVVGILDLDGANIGSELLDLSDALRSWCKEEDMKFNEIFFKAALDGYLSKNNQKNITENAKEAMIAITNRLSLRFLIDAFEQKHFRWDNKKYSSAYEANLDRSKQYLNYCHSIIEILN
jgi:Ser/Thr protein kinase RdoA (MazF antagonist)